MKKAAIVAVMVLALAACGSKGGSPKVNSLSTFDVASGLSCRAWKAPSDPDAVRSADCDYNGTPVELDDFGTADKAERASKRQHDNVCGFAASGSHWVRGSTWLIFLENAGNATDAEAIAGDTLGQAVSVTC